MTLIRDSHRYFLIRHGETDWNKEFRYQGSTDSALNDEGLEQARRVAVRLSSVEPARVCSSPLMRASRTAQVIMEHNEGTAEIELLPDLKEISFGCWEGLSIPEIQELDGAMFEQWRRAPFSCTPSGGESFSEIMARTKNAAEILAEGSEPGGATFVVAHGGLLRALIAVMLRFDDIDILWKMRFDNCSVTVIDVWGTRPSLLLTNDTHHLRVSGDELIASLVFPL